MALAVGRGGAPCDVGYGDDTSVKVELVEDTPVANTAAGGIRDAVQSDGVPGEGINGESLELEE